MRSAALLYLSLFAAGCAARGQQSQTPSQIVLTARDRALARNVLELEGSNIPLMIPMLQLDSLAIGRRPAPRATWWMAGFAFIGIELVAHLALQLRGRPSFFNGRG